MLERFVAFVRLGHPFPSILNAAATAAIATLAGADAPVAARLGLSMLGIQVSIGVLNDVVDAPRDSMQKPAKPIPSGLVSPRSGLVLAAAAAIAGLLLSAVSGPATLTVAAAGLTLGYGYDLRLSRTRWSWLPLSLALPLVPVHAWLGATGSVPPGLVALVPAALLAGTALAIANGIVDVERDARAGRVAIAVALGPWRAWLVHAALLAVVAVLAVVAAPAVAPVPPVPPAPGGQGSPGALSLEALRLLRSGGIAVGLLAVGVGAAALASPRAAVRERGWELEAVGVAAVGLGWLAGAAALGRG